MGRRICGIIQARGRSCCRMQHNQMPADKLLGFSNPQYDLAAKRILSERSVAAYLLKGTVPEFKEASLGDIAV